MAMYVMVNIDESDCRISGDEGGGGYGRLGGRM